ncbi:hypothetical protein [Streptomyces cinereoruber]|uniref:hypothetical protein n=1 Tax=Streptomyces cinereoruber TaxID=67260 RepID=UPI00363892B2
MREIDNAEVSCAAEMLERRGVDYRVIGSRAVRLYNIGESDGSSDIDLLVPRADINVLPEIRGDLRREFGRRVVLGTLPSLTTVNFMSDGISELQHRELSVPLEKGTLESSEVDGIKTLKPESLYGMYGTIGGLYREKDRSDRERLALLADSEPDPAFERFRQERESEYPLYLIAKKLGNTALKLVPKDWKLLSQDIMLRRREEKYSAI